MRFWPGVTLTGPTRYFSRCTPPGAAHADGAASTRKARQEISAHPARRVRNGTTTSYLFALLLQISGALQSSLRREDAAGGLVVCACVATVSRSRQVRVGRGGRGGRRRQAWPHLVPAGRPVGRRQTGGGGGLLARGLRRGELRARLRALSVELGPGRRGRGLPRATVPSAEGV